VASKIKGKEIIVMAKKILVALRTQNPLEEIMPYLDEMTQPGVRVVLLLRYQESGISASPRDGWDGAAAWGNGVSEWKKNRASESPEAEQNRLSEMKVFLAEEALRRRGVDIITDVYVGSLRKVIKDYVRRGDVHLIVMQKRFGLGNFSILKKVRLTFGYFKKPELSSWLVLLDPNNGISALKRCLSH
jgi:hypothetical protein